MTPPSGVGPLVLLVDDYADNRAMYARFLVYAGYRIDEATNGQEALDKANELLPDLIGRPALRITAFWTVDANRLPFTPSRGPPPSSSLSSKSLRRPVVSPAGAPSFGISVLDPA